MSALLSRYAESIYWLARYVERAENLARILDVNESFSRDSRGGQNWGSIVTLYADEENFRERHGSGEPDAGSVLRYYLLDTGNTGSVVSSIRAARDNARTLRPLISTEMWAQLNMFYNWVRALGPEDVAEERLARLCARIKEGCQTHTGITEGTFYRDAGWHFYQIGRCIERADQPPRLLDVKYPLLLPRIADVGSPLDVSQWNALLRSAAGYHAFRRIYPSGMTVPKIAQFLLFNPSFPRSVLACVNELDRMVTEVRSRYHLRGGVAASEELDDLRSVLGHEPIDSVLERGLHEFIDWVQVRLNAMHSALGRDFFGSGVEQGQRQSA